MLHGPVTLPASATGAVSAPSGPRPRVPGQARRSASQPRRAAGRTVWRRPAPTIARHRPAAGISAPAAPPQPRREATAAPPEGNGPNECRSSGASGTLLSRLRGRSGGGPLARQRKRRAKPRQRPVTLRGPPPAPPAQREGRRRGAAPAAPGDRREMRIWQPADGRSSQPPRQRRASASYASAACRIWATGQYSSVWWAMCISPGPRITVGGRPQAGVSAEASVK